MVRTGLAYDDRFLEHQTGPNHPERPERLLCIVRGLHDKNLWQKLEHISFEPTDRFWIERIHHLGYVDRCFAACTQGKPFIDTPDSTICSASATLAQLAVGALLASVDAVMDGVVNNAFCAIRPPGHHAEADRSMGFCLFNNIAIAAEYLIVRHGLTRVAIIDWDVHHGNGTQHIFEHRSDVLFVSLHEDPSIQYPGTGFAHEQGLDLGEGFTMNIPLSPGSGDAIYKAEFKGQIQPLLRRFKPEFILVSAGFDASGGDPLGHLEVTADGFRWLTRHLRAEANRWCDGRIVSVLEGGYDLDSLARCVGSHVGALAAELNQGD